MMGEETVLGSEVPETVASPTLPGHLRDLRDRAREYVEAASSTNTRRAYAADWKHFTAWCRRISGILSRVDAAVSAATRPLPYQRD
jgi:hypothetical protein